MIKRFIIGTLSLLPYFILAQTAITGVIEGNQNWTAAGSPYQVTNGILKQRVPKWNLKMNSYVAVN
jgi:hypothetical protein